MQADSPAALRKYEERLVRHLPPDAEPATRQMALRAAIEGIGLDPRATQSTLGQPYANLGLAPILATTRKLLAVGRGEAQPDDRDAMAYQRAMGPEDLIAERIAKDYSGTRRNLLMRASFMGGLKAVPPLALNRQVESALLHSGLGQYLEEINAAEVFDKQGRVTRMGEGGLPGADSIPDSARGVHGSQLGVIDPLRTPESSRSGVDLYFSRMARKGTDGQMYAPFEDVRTGKTVYRSPQQIADLTVGFPQCASDAGRSHVAAVRQGQLRYEKQSNLDLRVPHFENAFSPLANLIPLKSAAQGQRGSMGSRFLRSNSPLLRSPFARRLNTRRNRWRTICNCRRHSICIYLAGERLRSAWRIALPICALEQSAGSHSSGKRATTTAAVSRWRSEFVRKDVSLSLSSLASSAASGSNITTSGRPRKCVWIRLSCAADIDFPNRATPLGPIRQTSDAPSQMNTGPVDSTRCNP